MTRKVPMMHLIVGFQSWFGFPLNVQRLSQKVINRWISVGGKLKTSAPMDGHAGSHEVKDRWISVGGRVSYECPAIVATTS